MNILLMTNSMKQPDDTYSAKTDVVFYFAKEWVKAGHRVVVIHNESKFPIIFYKVPKFLVTKMQRKRFFVVPSVSSRRPLKREQDGVLIYRLPMLKLIPHAGFFNFQYGKQIRLISEYLSSIDFVPDIITGHWLEPQLKLIHELGGNYKARTGFVIHGKLSTSLKDSYKEYIKQLNCFFLRSQSMKEFTLSGEQKSFMPQHVSVCYSGIPDEYITSIIKRNDWKKDNVFKIIYVGRLVAYKKIDALLEAVANSLPDVEFRLDIIGEGDEKDALQRQTVALGIDRRVVFHGRIKRDEVQKKLREADCFAMISENEVFGLAYLEAMAAGCITIASIGGGVDGIIINGENGYLCEQGNSYKLGELLKSIIQMPMKEVEKIRNCAWDTVCSFTDSKVADRYLQDIINT